MTAPTSTHPSGGHQAEDFRVDGQGQVQVGDRYYYTSEWALPVLWNAITVLQLVQTIRQMPLPRLLPRSPTNSSKYHGIPVPPSLDEKRFVNNSNHPASRQARQLQEGRRRDLSFTGWGDLARRRYASSSSKITVKSRCPLSCSASSNDKI